MFLPKKATAQCDDFATDAIAVRVGAMDVSVKRSAAEFGANVIARSVDRATTAECVVGDLKRLPVFARNVFGNY
jgi:hypothetical protein